MANKTPKKSKKSNEIMDEAEAAKAAEPAKTRKRKSKQAKKARKTDKVRTAERIEESEDEATRTRKPIDEGLETIGKLVDHPLVADIVTAGAVAAVASLAEKQVTRARGTGGGSKETLKFAGMAAAAAMGKRFMAEMEAAKARREEAEEAEDDLDGEEE